MERVEAGKQAIICGLPYATTKAGVKLVVDHEVAMRLLDHENPQDPAVVPLEKPCKNFILLQYALTNSNGAEWRQQRPLILKVFNDRPSRQRSVEAARSVAREMLSDAARVDVRDFALRVAVRAMVAAIFEEGATRTNVEQHLSQHYEASLKPRNDADPAHKLAEAVRAAVANTQSTSYIARVLAESLSQEEAYSNCHSALLAGTQSIATVLVGSMLFMAEHTESSYTLPQVVKETLRILPPVSSLPRCASQEIRLDSITVRPNETVLIDVLALAHTKDKESWKFRPGRSSKGCPFGLGDRQCPAGGLSVAVVRAVLEEISSERTWSLCDKNDCVGPSGKDGWIKEVSYQPTLIYPAPILIEFCCKEEPA